MGEAAYPQSRMEEVDLERLVLPALLTLLVFGTFIVLVTSGGGDGRAPAVKPLPATAPAATPVPAAHKKSAPRAPAPAGRFVKVRQGDSAGAIADRAKISVERLAELNPSVDVDSLRPGQTLKLAP